MSYVASYSASSLGKKDVEAMTGTTLLEFGTNWCGHCKAAQAAIEATLAEFPHVRHLKIEDGPGRRLGRTYTVKQWPTLILIHNGQEVGRIVRQQEASAIRDLMASVPAA